MAFTPFNVNEIAAGQPTKQELFNKLRLDLDDHESRLLTVEGATNAFLSLDFYVSGKYSFLSTQENVAGIWRPTFNLTILSARLFIETAGASGSTEIDVLFKRGVDPFTSIYTTRPSVSFSDGDLAISTNGVLNPTYVDLQAGDLVRMDLTAVQGGTYPDDPSGFACFVEFEKT